MQESPHRKPLLVLEQSFGEHLKRPLVLVTINLLQRDAVRCEQPVEQILKRRSFECALDEIRNPAMLAQNLEKMLIAKARHCFDGPELLALRAARGAEVSPELRKPLRWQRLERGELRRDDSHQSVQPLHCTHGAQSVTILESRDERGELVQNELEPKLAGLMDDDEQQLVRVLRRRAQTLQRQQLIESQV